MNLVVVSNTTMNPLATLLSELEVVCSGTGDLVQWLLDSSSPPSNDDAEIVLVVVDASQLTPPMSPGGSTDEFFDHLTAFVKRNPDKLVIASTPVGSSRAATTFADPADLHGQFASKARWNSRLAQLAADAPNVAVLDVDELVAKSGRDWFLTNKYWYLGRIRFTQHGFQSIAEEIRSLLAAWRSRSRKVLVLDLDNTLWGGVLGEEGLGGIALSEDGIGKCFRDFQRHIARLRDAGVLLAVVSKNDPESVHDVFDKHPAMHLKSHDFVRIDASWSNKADRLRDLSDSLSLGLDSFVFIDDNPVERDLVRRELPEVVVPEFPDEPELLSRWFLEDVALVHFPRLRILEEDRKKTNQYRARELRTKAATADLQGFLDSLDIRLTFRTNDPALIQRVSQLTQKTNQFNLTTERLTPSEVAGVMESKAGLVITCDYADRFGDEGTIGLAVVDVAKGSLRNLLLSCRVLGRGVEQALLTESERQAHDRGVKSLSARFVPNSRNAVAKDFLPAAGYAPTSDGDIWIGKKVFK